MATRQSSGAYSPYSNSLSPGSGEQGGLKIEEKAFSLFQPDILLPAQYLATTQRKLHLEPEKRLMLAVLEDAIACFQKYATTSRGRGRVLFLDAEEWILDDSHLWLFSFENVCDGLGFHPKYLRDGLMRWKEQALKNKRPPKEDESLRLVG